MDLGDSGAINHSLNFAQIQEYLPHRFPFLLIDRVVDYRLNESITAIKMVSNLDPYLQGHFPGNPVMPGVLIVEALAQASGVLGRLSRGQECQTCLLTEVNDTRFRRLVVPGDVLQLNVQIVRARQSFFWFEGEATVDGDLAAAAKFTAKLA